MCNCASRSVGREDRRETLLAITFSVAPFPSRIKPLLECTLTSPVPASNRPMVMCRSADTVIFWLSVVMSPRIATASLPGVVDPASMVTLPVPEATMVSLVSRKTIFPSGVISESDTSGNSVATLSATSRMVMLSAIKELLPPSNDCSVRARAPLLAMTAFPLEESSFTWVSSASPNAMPPGASMVRVSDCMFRSAPFASVIAPPLIMLTSSPSATTNPKRIFPRAFSTKWASDPRTSAETRSRSPPPT